MHTSAPLCLCVEPRLSAFLRVLRVPSAPSAFLPSFAATYRFITAKPMLSVHA